MYKRQKRVVTCGCYVGILAAVLGVCGMAFFSFVLLMMYGFEQLAFWSLTWSPDGSKLAFIEFEDHHFSVLYVVDADGQNLQHLAGSYEGEVFRGEFTFLQWSDDGQTLYFGREGGWGYDGEYYRIDVTGENLQPISDEQIPSQVPYEISLTDQHKLCAEPIFIESRAIHPNGLMAQSACMDDYFTNRLSPRDECNHELQVCDVTNGEPVFTFDFEAYRVAKYGHRYFQVPTWLDASFWVMRGGLALMVLSILGWLVMHIKQRQTIRRLGDEHQGCE